MPKVMKYVGGTNDKGECLWRMWLWSQRQALQGLHFINGKDGGATVHLSLPVSVTCELAALTSAQPTAHSVYTCFRLVGLGFFNVSVDFERKKGRGRRRKTLTSCLPHAPLPVSWACILTKIKPATFPCTGWCLTNWASHSGLWLCFNCTVPVMSLDWWTRWSVPRVGQATKREPVSYLRS